MTWDQQGAGTGGAGGSGGAGGYGAGPGGPSGPAGPGGYGPNSGPGGFGSAYGPGGVFGIPPQPPTAPPVPRAPADPLRALAVALLNLSGLGLGYALLRRWFAMAVCWAATGALLFVALPADADGVSGAAVVAYAVFLVLAAAHGAFRGLRTPLSWPPKAPLAVLLGLVLLAVPVGGVVYYGDAHDDATQKMLLDRLAQADQLVLAGKDKPFDVNKAGFGSALATYHDLRVHHPHSRAAKLLPDRLATYYATIAGPYDRKEYCVAIGPLSYLRTTVPSTYGAKNLGSLAGWPDDRLATSLYECGASGLDQDRGTQETDADLGQLLTTFPKSPQAAKVEPAVRATIDATAKGLSGGDPCAVTDQLRTLSTRAADLPGDAAGVADALTADARKADGYVESGSYTCGVNQYTHGKFSTALTTMNDFIGKYPNDRNRALAQRIAIAAEVAEKLPAAGKHLPTLASGGGIPVTIINDSPHPVDILFTGPVTGRFTLKACGSCSAYSSRTVAHASACKASGRHYPQKSLELPAGTVYFLHKPSGDAAGETPATDTSTLEYGYIYTECAYTLTTGFASY